MLSVYLQSNKSFSTLSRSFSSLSDDSEESRARYLYRQWVGLGLTDVHLSNHTVLLSLPGSTPNTITDRSSHQCFMPNGTPCDQRGPNDLTKQQFSYAAYSAMGSVQVWLCCVVSCWHFLKRRLCNLSGCWNPVLVFLTPNPSHGHEQRSWQELLGSNADNLFNQSSVLNCCLIYLIYCNCLNEKDTYVILSSFSNSRLFEMQKAPRF